MSDKREKTIVVLDEAIKMIDEYEKKIDDLEKRLRMSGCELNSLFEQENDYDHEGLVIQQLEDGSLREYIPPFASIEVKDEEQFNMFQAAVKEYLKWPWNIFDKTNHPLEASELILCVDGKINNVNYENAIVYGTYCNGYYYMMGEWLIEEDMIKAWRYLPEAPQEVLNE